jgi:uncharacterized membrane protein YidH (DUF202 family)
MRGIGSIEDPSVIRAILEHLGLWLARARPPPKAVVGLACIPIGMITTVIGVARYQRMNKQIEVVRNRSKTKSRQTNENTEP